MGAAIGEGETPWLSWRVAELWRAPSCETRAPRIKLKRAHASFCLGTAPQTETTQPPLVGNGMYVGSTSHGKKRTILAEALASVHGPFFGGVLLTGLMPPGNPSPDARGPSAA